MHRLKAWAELRIENAPKSARATETPSADQQVQNILQEAYRLRTQRVEVKITPLTVLEAICTPEVGFSAKQLKRFPLDLSQIQDGRNNITKLAEALSDTITTKNNTTTTSKNGLKSSKSIGTNALEKYCENLTDRARQGKIDSANVFPLM